MEGFIDTLTPAGQREGTASGGGERGSDSHSEGVVCLFGNNNVIGRNV